MKFLAFQRWWRLKKTGIYTKLIKKEFGEIGCGSLLVPPFISFYPGRICIGKNVTVNSKCWLDCIIDYSGDNYESRLEIGDGTYIGNGAHIIACSHMKIGKNVVIADNVYITDNLHGYDDIHQPIMSQKLVCPGQVMIEDEAWLGEKVSVMPNVTIGKHAIVGSNSVVTKSIPPFSVAVGVPARIIKQYNFESNNWERI